MQRHIRNIGRIDISALYYPPEKHEYEVARYFAKMGFSIVFIKPRSIKGVHTPDFVMNNKNWEVKSPKVYGKSSFEYNCRKAQKQSEHIIFDLRRLGVIDSQKYLNELMKWNATTKIKTLLVITKDGKLLDVKGKF